MSQKGRNIVSNAMATLVSDGMETRAAASLGLVIIALCCISLGFIPGLNLPGHIKTEARLERLSETKELLQPSVALPNTPPASPPSLAFMAFPTVKAHNQYLMTSNDIRSWPRLKPSRSKSSTFDRPIVKPIHLNQPFMVEHQEIAFATTSDFTGQYIASQTSNFLDPHKSDKVSIKLKRGESLSTVLTRAGIAAEEHQAVTNALEKEYKLRRLKSGDIFHVQAVNPAYTEFQEAALSPDERTLKLLKLEFSPGGVQNISVQRLENDQFEAMTHNKQTQLRYHTIEGSISSSLFLSAKRAGMPTEIVAKLANMFPYDIDFQRDIRKGDTFEAVYEVYYDSDGQIASYGNIVFGKMSWRNRSREKGYYRAIIDGRAQYFDAKGQSAKRLLMKTPIEGARITSSFGRRRHPVLGYTKKHKGVDFGARRGTPIMAAGDGIIERANRFGSFGNYVKIKHSNGYQTAYAHLQKFGRGIKKGKRVRQGDIIGYVGTTGRSTGPHLHYEVLKKGRQVNPMGLKMATGRKLTGADLTYFDSEKHWVEQLRYQPAMHMAEAH